MRHKARRRYDPDARDFLKLFFLCEQLDDRSPYAGLETSDARFFRRDALPRLSAGRVLDEDIEAAFRYVEEATPVTVFD